MIVLALIFSLMASLAHAQNFVDIKPSPQQVEWQDLEFGVLIHCGTNTYLDREWGDGTASPQVFNPTQFDAEQWMRAIKAAGAKYVVLVAKHHDGFCLWPTEQTDYGVKSSPWENGHGDVVRQVSDAARKFGLKFGVYLSPWDRHEPRYKNYAEYDHYYIAELQELITNYGDLVEFWLDGAGSEGHVYNFPRIIEKLRIYQPNTLVFADVALFEYGDIRWAGNEDGTIPYENWNVIDRHGYLRWRPVEADTPLHKEHWFWHSNDEATLKSVAELITTYEETIGRGGQLMLGIEPDRRGLLTDADVKRLEEFGAAIRKRYSENLVVTEHLRTNVASKAALDGDPSTFWSAPSGSHHATIEVSFAKPVTFDHALTMEWLNDGQHVEHFRIEAWNGKAWTTVVGGRAIGHKRIDHFAPATASRVRLNILSSSAEAHIREFQLFNQVSCPVTVPNQSEPPVRNFGGTLTYSPEYQGTRDGAVKNSHGNEKLWTILWPGGTVVFQREGPGFLVSDGSLSMKWPWWQGVPGKLSIQGRRLDRSAPPLRANISQRNDETGFLPTSLIFPTEGCWEVTGKVGETSLTFVTRVVSFRGAK